MSPNQLYCVYDYNAGAVVSIHTLYSMATKRRNTVVLNCPPDSKMEPEKRYVVKPLPEVLQWLYSAREFNIYD